MPAPIGNKNAAKAKIWHGAIMRALRKRSRTEALEALDELAEKLLDKVAEGDLPALKEFGDRLDGKPAQTIIGDDENPLNVVHKIERAIVNAKDSDS